MAGAPTKSLPSASWPVPGETRPAPTPSASLPEPVPGLRGLTAYAVPKHPSPIDLPLHGNEGPPPPAALFDTLRDPEVLRRYPSAAPLEAFLAASLGVSKDRVLVTAGADEALDRAFRTFLQAGDEVVLPSPTFVMLPHYAKVVGATVRAPAWPSETFPEDEVLAATNEKTKVIALVSPNNPTGAIIPFETMVRVAAHAPQAAVLVDFAYIETADTDPTAEVLGTIPNALVFRTLSKVWGLAGLRVGYVVGPEPMIRALRAAGPPFSVTAPSVALALAHLTPGGPGEQRMRAYVAAVRAERALLFSTLAEVGISPVESQANFVFGRFAQDSHARWFRDGLAGLGIGIRIFPGEPGLSDGMRMTCPGDAAQTTRLIDAIRAVVRPTRRVEGPAALDAFLSEGGRGAWYFGSDLASLAKARQAGLVPIGLAEPETEIAARMYSQGVARVVRDSNDIAESLL